jgi:hypothetical protein
MHLNQLNTQHSSSGVCFFRLAAAGCFHTAVALELSAGQARAAELTRARGNPTTHRQGIPRFQLEDSFSGFLYKKTDSDAHRAHPEPSVVERPPTAGWTGTPSRPGTGGRQPGDPRPHVLSRGSPAPRPATAADSAGESFNCRCQAGGATHGPGDGSALP